MYQCSNVSFLVSHFKSEGLLKKALQPIDGKHRFLRSAIKGLPLEVLFHYLKKKVYFCIQNKMINKDGYISRY